MESLLKMLRITNAPTVPVGDDEIAEVEEPPDDRVPDMKSNFTRSYLRRPSAPSMLRRESLLTRAIQAGHDGSPTTQHMPEIPRGLSITSSHSFASTAELTSDIDSLSRSASPSPPPPLNRLSVIPFTNPTEDGKVHIAPITTDDKPLVVPQGEAAVEQTLGRKRCIMFACGDPSTADTVKTIEAKPNVEVAPEMAPALRKCRISFACPSKPAIETKRTTSVQGVVRRQSSPPLFVQTTAERSSQTQRRATEATIGVNHSIQAFATPTEGKTTPPPRHMFHEFACSQNNSEEWLDKHSDLVQPKLTIDDCLRKENAIRKLGKEAEEEAEEEEREMEEIDDDNDDAANEDDFAPSDDDAEYSSDDGNESDNEAGFADSDDESDAGSEYRFWAPSANTTRATSVENMTHFSARQPSRSRASSTSSADSIPYNESRRASVVRIKATRPIKMRPGTPELPDSTDFVCGTFDEDRPLEAAYISCREQKRRQKQILLPQDIDPSFPTSDPDDEEDEDDDEVADSSDHIWVKGQFEGFDEDVRGRRPTTATIPISPKHSPVHNIAAPRPMRPATTNRTTLRSPPPPKHNMGRSPAPRRLFDHAPMRMKSPPPRPRLRSPRGSPTGHKVTPFGITINHLAQRPGADKTSSLPHTPNPFFRNWKNGKQPISRITSGQQTSGNESPNPDLHVRGPVDIVIGLEKKRQKRKEKYWRQHCRKTAKEHAEKRPPPGRGAERMKELGLECAERNRGYGLGPAAQHVLSL